MTRTERPLTVTALAILFAAAIAAPSFADPPPWAPAYGWRAHHEHEEEEEHEHGRRHWHHRPAHVVVVKPPRYVAVPERGTGSCHRDLLGTIFGGAAGAAAGTQIGKGNGQIASVIAGTIIGGVIGGIIGQSMDEVDTQCVGQALEHAQTGQPIAWRDPAQNITYTVTPTRTWQAPDGRYCREYTESAVIDGQHRQVYGTACRQPDGSWQIQK